MITEITATIEPKVRKRDGVTLQSYDANKIKKALLRAWGDTGSPIDERKLNKVLKSVVDTTKQDIIDVETVQDAVETSLMRSHLFDVAKSYIIYRQKRSEAREQRKINPDSKAISDYIHASKYARYRSEEFRREVYEETVERTESMHIRKYPQHSEAISEAFSYVKEKKLLPSMRSMQFGGTAVEVNNARIYNCSFSFIDRVEAFSEALFLLLSGCGVGYSVQFDHVEKLPSIPYINPKLVRHHVVEDTIEGWADALKALIQSFLDGVFLEISYHKIRPAGSPLKISGGRAPGHLKLKDPLEKIRNVLSAAQGRKLRPIECHRIMCHAADSVLSGGIRRSAMICLFSLDDSEMMNCKTGNWWSNDPWFANANNSVVLKRDEVKKKQFKRIFQMTKQWGEPGFYFTHDYDYGTNPCFHPDTLISTDKGLKKISDLCEEYEGKTGLKIFAQTQYGPVLKNAKVFKTGIKKVIEVHTKRGRVLKVTPDHRLMTTKGWTQAQDLTADSVIYLQSGRLESSVKDSGLDLMWFNTAGYYINNGFGYSTKSSKEKYSRFLNIDDSEDGLINFKNDYSMNILRSISFDTESLPHERVISDSIFKASNNEQYAFISGLLSASGEIKSDSIYINSVSPHILRGVQNILLNFGVDSSISGQTLRIKGGNAHTLKEHLLRVGVVCSDKLLDLSNSSFTRPLNVGISFIDELSKIVDNGEVVEVFDITEPETHSLIANGIVAHNCCEIGLNPKLVINEYVKNELNAKGINVEVGRVYTGWSFCNLCEINGAKLGSLEDFKKVAKAATLIGTLQATYTKLPYLGWVSEYIAEREALLGIGITGMLDSPAISCNPEYQREIAINIKEWNTEYSKMLGIKPAARTTCVKPSGTTSLELGCVGSGHHAHHARRYIRRVTADELEYVFQNFKLVNPHMCVRKPDGKYVIEFPVEAPAGAIVKDDLSAIQFLEMVKSTQQNWVIPGTSDESISPGLSHNVSNTVNVKPDEWEHVAEYLWDNRNYFTGVSLLSASGDKDYAFAPMEAVVNDADEARWNAILAQYKPVDYMNMVEATDETSLNSEAACAGGSCAVV